MGAQGRLQLCLVKLIEEYKVQLFKFSARCGVTWVFVSVLCCQVFVCFVAAKDKAANLSVRSGSTMHLGRVSMALQGPWGNWSR